VPGLMPRQVPCGHLVDERAGFRPLTWKRPPGAPAGPRGRFRVGLRGGSQLLRLRYNIDEFMTSQAGIPSDSSHNPRSDTDLTALAGLGVVHMLVHRNDDVPVDDRIRTAVPRRSNHQGGPPCC
jgi:hypothetical protein